MRRGLLPGRSWFGSAGHSPRRRLSPSICEGDYPPNHDSPGNDGGSKSSCASRLLFFGSDAPRLPGSTRGTTDNLRVSWITRDLLLDSAAIDFSSSNPRSWKGCLAVIVGILPKAQNIAQKFNGNSDRRISYRRRESQCRKMKLLSCFTSNARLDWFIEWKLASHIFFMV